MVRLRPDLTFKAKGELLNGLGRGSGGPTPRLLAKTGGPLRAQKFASGIGACGPV